MASLSIDTHDAMPGLEPKKIHVEQVEEKGSSSSSNQLTEDDLNTADWTAEEERKIV
jgi:fructose-specific phosphotransferase system component IIB